MEELLIEKAPGFEQVRLENDGYYDSPHQGVQKMVKIHDAVMLSKAFIL